MADGAALVEEGIGPAQSPLVAVSFQRNVHRKEKYLEAEPKALGITQIGLSVFHITCVAVFLSKGLSNEQADIPFFISSLLLIIAGSLAVAARNLHLPTDLNIESFVSYVIQSVNVLLNTCLISPVLQLKACLGMQIVACVASVFNVIFSMTIMDITYYGCWHYHDTSNFTNLEEICHKLESTNSHFFAEVMVIQAALFAISVTLAAYCCKVVNCCSPAPKMPVITVHVPPVQQ